MVSGVQLIATARRELRSAALKTAARSSRTPRHIISNRRAASKRLLHLGGVRQWASREEPAMIMRLDRFLEPACAHLLACDHEGQLDPPSPGFS